MAPLYTRGHRSHRGTGPGESQDWSPSVPASHLRLFHRSCSRPHECSPLVALLRSSVPLSLQPAVQLSQSSKTSQKTRTQVLALEAAGGRMVCDSCKIIGQLFFRYGKLKILSFQVIPLRNSIVDEWCLGAYSIDFCFAFATSQGLGSWDR